MPLQDTLLRRPLVRWGLLIGFWILVGFVFVGYSYLIHVNAGIPFARSKVLWIVVGWSLWIPLTPLVIGLSRRFPIERQRWGRRLALHVAIASVIVVVEVVVFVGIRALAVMWTGDAGFGATMTETSFSFNKAFRDSLLRTFFFDLLIYMIIVAIVHALDYYQRYRERDLRTAQLEAQLAQAHVQALRMQLNPHFLFNTLHAISSMIDENVKGARTMIADLSDLLRHSLDRAGEQELPLKEEVALLRRYLKIEQTRFQDRLLVQMDIEEETRVALVPNLMLQPLVENAIKHGIAPFAAAGRIEIRAQRRGERLQLQVQDSGPGLSESFEQDCNKGVGLKNTRERLTELYGTDYRFELQNLPDRGCLATLEIPFRPAEKIENA